MLIWQSMVPPDDKDQPVARVILHAKAVVDRECVRGRPKAAALRVMNELGIGVEPMSPDIIGVIVVL